jgi:magnesium transporter
MIRYYAKQNLVDHLQEKEAFLPGSWIYAEKPDKTEIEALAEVYSLDRAILKDALDVDEIPRYEKDGDIVYIFVRFSYQETPHKVNTAPLLFVFAKDYVLTVSPVRLPVLDAFLNGEVNNFVTTDPSVLLLKIMYYINVGYDTMINHTSKEIKRVRSRLTKREISAADFVSFIAIEDALNEFLSSLKPTSVTLKRLLTDGEVPGFKKNEDTLEDLILNNEQSLQECTSNLERINSIRRNYASISSHNLDRTMRVLAAASVLIALPNLFYGMFGMNVALPFQHKPWAYAFIVCGSLFIMLIVLIIGRKKNLF